MNACFHVAYANLCTDYLNTTVKIITRPKTISSLILSNFSMPV